MRTRIRAYDQVGRVIHEWITVNTPDPDERWDNVTYSPEYGNGFPSKIGVDYVPNEPVTIELPASAVTEL